MKKILSLLFALLFVISFAACGNESDESKDPGSAISEDSQNDNSQPQDETENFVLANVKYIGEDFTILTSGVNPTFHSDMVPIDENEWHNADESFSDRINEAVINRNNEVLEKIGVKIKEIYFYDSGRHSKDTLAKIRADSLGGEKQYQAVNICLYDCGTLAVEGLLYDLTSFENLELSNPWWDQSVNYEVTIDNKQFFFVGDISNNHKGATPAVFFNKTLFEKLNLEDPYELVKDYKWTIDKAHEICKESGFARDVNDDGIINYEDNFCWGGQNDDIYAMVYGSGVRILSPDGEGMPSLTLYNEKSVKAVDKIFDLMLDENVYVSGNHYFTVVDWPMKLIRDAFIAGNALFYSTSVGDAVTFDAMEDDFGILPVPLFDSNQTEYYSLINTWVSNAFAIAYNINNETAEFAAAVLDYMGHSSWKGRGAGYLGTDYYDVVLKFQKLRSDDQAMEILDKVYEARGVELGAVFNIGKKTSIPINTMLGSMMDRKEKGTFTSEYEKYAQSFELDVNNLVDSFKNQ